MGPCTLRFMDYSSISRMHPNDLDYIVIHIYMDDTEELLPPN